MFVNDQQERVLTAMIKNIADLKSKAFGLAGVIIGCVGLSLPVYANDCSASLAELNERRNGPNLASISAAINNFKEEANCSDQTIDIALVQTAAILGQKAQELIDSNALEDAEDLLSIAPATHWLVQVSRADIAAKRNDRKTAAELYNAGLDTILDENLTPDSEKLSDVARQIAMLAQENTMLAGSTSNTISRSDGRATGVYGALTRGLAFVPANADTKTNVKSYNGGINKEIYNNRPIKSAYIPIKFATDSDRLDHAGEQEALKLAKFINSYQIKLIQLVGHTDERGSYDYNQDLSERRARTLKSFLQNKGKVAAVIIASGRGEKEPPRISDKSIYSIEQIQAISRRVELALN